MLSYEQVKMLRQYTDEDIDRMITKNNRPIHLDPLSVLVAREKYQPGFLTGYPNQI